MARVTDEQVDFILADFTKRGIVLEDLRDDLLDHMCCIIENEMSEDDNFYRFYEYVLPWFFKEELAEIQRETDNLIRFKNFYSMMKMLKFSGMLTVIFSLAGALFKTMHWPGAGMMIVLGGFFFSLVFLPLLIALKMKDDASKVDKAVFALGFFLAMVMAIGLLFKLMHWPGANILMISGTVSFTFIYVPIYFFSRYRRPELKFNTAVNTVLMLACGGIFFSLFNISFSKKYLDSMKSQNLEIHENSLLIYASNERLLAATDDSLAKQIHLTTVELDKELEQVVEALVENPQQHQANDKAKSIKEKITAYNSVLSPINDDKIVKVDLAPLLVFDQLDAELKIRILTNIQQQIAINENLYLTAL